MKDDLCVTCKEFSRLGYLFVKTFNGRRCVTCVFALDREEIFSFSSFLSFFLSLFPSFRLRHAPRSRKKSICTIRVIGDGFDMGWARCNQLFQRRIVLHRVTVLELVKFALILHFAVDSQRCAFSRVLFSPLPSLSLSLYSDR